MVRWSSFAASANFVFVFALVFSFPLQVFLQSPFPALIPYGLLFLSAILTLQGNDWRLVIHRFTATDVCVAFYLYFMILHLLFSFMDETQNFAATASALVVYVLPVCFYLHARCLLVSRQLQRSIVTALAVSGLLVGVLFCVESYQKVILGEISEYSRAAFDYTVDRSGQARSEVNSVRVAPGHRSYGVMETHTASGAWIVLGYLATMVLVYNQSVRLKLAVFLFFGSMLMVGMNYTNIFAFLFVSWIVTGRGLDVLVGRITKKYVVYGLFIFLSILLVASLSAIFVNREEGGLFDILIETTISQLNLIFGTGGKTNSFVNIFSEYFQSLYEHILANPAVLILGDGPLSSELGKGGDIGWLETLARFGLIAFSIFGIGLLKVAYQSYRFASSLKTQWARSLQVVIYGTIFLIFVNELHYSIWILKSILPVLMIVIGIYSYQRASKDIL